MKTLLDIPMFIGGKKSGPVILLRFILLMIISICWVIIIRAVRRKYRLAIDAALKARETWASMPWEERASVFLKAADLLSGPYRIKINAATMLGQSKNIFQAEIDAACELTDFLRFNVKYMTDLYKFQPHSPPGVWNRLEWRPLEGFVFALTPFNFTSIAGNLPTAPAILGNVVVWKPSKAQIYSARVIMDVLREAGLPDGVINHGICLRTRCEQGGFIASLLLQVFIIPVQPRFFRPSGKPLVTISIIIIPIRGLWVKPAEKIL